MAQNSPQTLSSLSKDTPFTFDEAMRRLAYLMALGCLVVVVCIIPIGVSGVRTAGVGLMIAFASTLGAGLVGFIFGVPFARDSTSPQPTGNASDGRAEKDTQASAYRANTSLEQIADWLTKILVGVGLVQIKEAPRALHSLVKYLAPGIGPGREAEVIVVASMIFFAVCGFLFGFLWARLYLRRWLSDADRDLIKTLTRFEADGRAYSLVSRQLERHEDEPEVPEHELLSAIQQASSSAKTRIFELARAASQDTESSQYHNIANPGAEAIFRALIADDVHARYHRTHGELGYTLDHRSPPDLAGSIDALSTAIERRDKLNKGGWRYYEFRRARNRINFSAEFKAGMPDKPEEVALIRKDLESAKQGDSLKFQKWVTDHANVAAWMKLNNVAL